VDARLSKLQHPKNRVLCATGNLDRCTPVHHLHATFKIPYVYDYVTKLCRKAVQDHLIPNVRATGQGEAMHRSIRGLNLKQF
jgi:hypothetical protein